MTTHDAAQTWWVHSRRLPVDDAYTTWFNAHSRCTVALREWNKAAPKARADAYRAYVAELALEEAAAIRLQELHLDLAA
jgi:hypothetical protein